MSSSTYKTISNIQRTQNVNSFFYFLSHNFIFKHFFYDDLVNNYVSKEGVLLTSRIIQFLWRVIKRIGYLLVLVILAILQNYNGNSLFAPLYLLLTVLGGLTKNIIRMDNDDYYAVRLLKVPATTYSKFLIDRYVIQQFVCGALGMIVVSQLLALPYWYCLLLQVAF